MEAAMDWLNENGAAISALAMVGTVVFTAAAAVAAWRTIRSERRLRRSDLKLHVRPSSSDDEEIDVLVWNVGAAKPIHAQWFLTQFLLGAVRQGGGGDSLGPLEPGTSARVPLTRFLAGEGCYIVITRLDADGVSRVVKRWYKLSPDPRMNDRSDLRSPNPYYQRSERPRRLYAYPNVKAWPSRSRAWFEILAGQRTARRDQ